jgi:hypothetical protein
MITHNNIRLLIPKDKHDQTAIPHLKKLSFEQLKPIVPDLLEWLQDMNWPVAKPIADILEPFVDEMTIEIVAILKSDDAMWKFWVMAVLLRKTTNPLLLNEIKRIAQFPTTDEIENEVNTVANDVLNGDYK